MNKETYNELWNEFLDLGERYNEKASIPQFSEAMLTFIFKMMFDCAPNKECIKKLTEHSMKLGYDWHLEDLKNNQ